MADAPAPYKEFLDDKKFFKENISEENRALVSRLASEKKFCYISGNLSLIEQEFQSLYQSLKFDPSGLFSSASSNVNYKNFFYCAYLSVLLRRYYEAYGKQAKADQYSEYSRRLLRCSVAAFNDEKPSLVNDVVDTFSTPKHAAKLRDKISWFNILRLEIVMARLTISNLLPLLENAHVLSKMNKALGTNVNVGQATKQLNAPSQAFNGLGVAVFGAHFLVEAGIMMKHIFFPSESEKEFKLWQRARQEFSKRFPNLIGDLFWTIVNALANFPAFFRLTPMVGNFILAGGLLFDFLFLIGVRYAKMKALFIKEKQFDHEMNKLLKDKNKDQQEEIKQGHDYRLLERQKTFLMAEKEKANAFFYFCMGAAAMLVAGFTASLLIAAPIAAPICFFVCGIAVAMYMSRESLADYREKSYLYHHRQLDDDKASLLKSKNAARSTFFFSFAKNALIPTIILAAFVVYWPAGVGLALAFAAVELASRYLPCCQKAKAESSEEKEPLLPPALRLGDENQTGSEEVDSDYDYNNLLATS